jgi:RimJ/RimL family protein N-acetyltransferase
MPVFHSIPTLETERLTLRAPTRADFTGYAEIMESPRAGYMFEKMTPREAWNYYASDVAGWVLDGYGYWTAVDRVSHAPRVFLGFTKPDDFPKLELGWMTTAASEGQGYAFEAAKAAQLWAFSTLGVDSFVSYITPANARSIALAQRLGATHDAAAPLPLGETSAETAVYRHRRAA